LSRRWSPATGVVWDAVAPGRWRGPPDSCEVAARLTAGVARRPGLGPPVPSPAWATGGFRVAVAPGAGRGPPAPAVGLTAGEARLPRLGCRVRVGRVVVTHFSSSCNYHYATEGPRPHCGPRRQCGPRERAGGAAAPSVGGVFCPVVLSAPSPVERARLRWCVPSPCGVRPAGRPPPA
jgi:hypothetical protein